MKKIFIYTFALVFLLNSLISCIRQDDSPVSVPPITGADLQPKVGGAAEPNQVWVELSTQKMTVTNREDWDLGFYSGNEFRVVLNSSLVMAVGKINGANNIDAVTPQSVSALQNVVQVATFTDNKQYIDDPSGNILTQTSGIDAISENDSENNVYLLNMGYKVYTGSTVPGSVYSIGDSRGWKKIRILRYNDGYKLQVADLASTTHDEFIIPKKADYNFNFFSIIKGISVDVQPPKNNWDICFSVFTNLTSAGTFDTSYIFADVALTNILGGTGAYEVTTASGQGETAYNNFKAESIDPSKLLFNDQRTIGSNWRTTTGANGAEVFSDRFYVIKDSNGVFFKLRFIRMKGDDGNRGYPEFEYQPL